MKKLALLLFIFTFNISNASSLYNDRYDNIDDIINTDDNASSSNIESLLNPHKKEKPVYKIKKQKNKFIKSKSIDEIKTDNNFKNKNVSKDNFNNKIKKDKNLSPEEINKNKELEEEIRKELKNYSIHYKINDTIITNYDLINRYNLLMSISRHFFINKSKDKAIKEIEKSIINDEIKHILITERRLKIDDKEVLKFIKNKFKGDTKNLQSFLNVTNISFDYYKRYIQLQLLWRKYILYYISPKIRIDRKKYEKPVEHKKLSIIQININADKNITNQHVSNIINKIKNGEKFETLAKNYSQDKKSKQSGGDIGYKKKADLPFGIAEIVWKLSLNEISIPIQFNNTFLIFKLYDTKIMKPLNIDNVLQSEYMLKINNSVKSLLSVKKQNIYIQKIEK